MAAPGGLTELAGRIDTWDQLVAETLGGAGAPERVREADAANATELRVPDWPAVPARIRSCLGKSIADPLFDIQSTAGETGRRLLQEEYAEWRLVSDENGPRRFELTTELAAYWDLLARHNPERLVELVTGFAGAKELDPVEVFGGHDPRGDDTSETARAEAFAGAFIGADHEEGPGNLPGPFNSGERAITCLSRDDNTLGALLNLVSASAIPILVTDALSGEPRFPSGSEAIPLLPKRAAQDCRASDPVVVERIVRLAAEGRLIRFDDPIGIYIVAVQSQDLLDPNGQPIPADWIELSRQGPDRGDGLVRHQRLVIEAPAGAGFRLGELRSRRNGERIRFGAQIAELVELAVYVRVSEAGRLPAEVEPVPQPQATPCPFQQGCERVERAKMQLLS